MDSSSLLSRHYSHDDMIHMVRLFIENGANVNVKDSAGWTALRCLSGYYNHENLNEIIRLLIDYGADVNAKQPEGMTPI